MTCLQEVTDICSNPAPLSLGEQRRYLKMTSKRLEESMGAVQRGLAKVITGLQSKVLPPMSPKVVTEEEVNRMVMYQGISVSYTWCSILGTMLFCSFRISENHC